MAVPVPVAVGAPAAGYPSPGGARARAWALWKALITLAGPVTNAGDATRSTSVVRDVLDEHRS